MGVSEMRIPPFYFSVQPDTGGFAGFEKLPFIGDVSARTKEWQVPVRIMACRYWFFVPESVYLYDKYDY